TDQASSATTEDILQLFNTNAAAFNRNAETLKKNAAAFNRNAETLKKNATALEELKESVSIITSQLKQEGYDLPGFQQEALATPQQPSLLVKETTSVEKLLSGLSKMIESRFDDIEAGMQKQQTMMDMLSGRVSTLTDLVATLDRKSEIHHGNIIARVAKCERARPQGDIGAHNVEFRENKNHVAPLLDYLSSDDEAVRWEDVRVIKPHSTSIPWDDDDMHVLPFLFEGDEDEEHLMGVETTSITTPLVVDTPTLPEEPKDLKEPRTPSLDHKVDSTSSSDGSITDIGAKPLTKTTKRKRVSRRQRKRRRHELMMVEQAKMKDKVSPSMSIYSNPTGCVEFTHPQWGCIQVNFPSHLYSKKTDAMNYKELLGWDGDF
ncbi:hypothetical protein LINGRAHAP2_LOCUS27715, partial [Linum grandiflorum]